MSVAASEDATSARISRSSGGICDALRGPWGLVDLGPALVLAGFSLLLLTLPYRQGLPNLPPFEVAAVAALATTLPLLLHRRFPDAVLLLATAAYLWYLALDTQQISGPSLAVYVALFSVGAFSRSRWKNATRLLSIGAIVAYIVLHVAGVAATIGSDVILVLIASVSYNLFISGAAVVMGNWYRQREVYEHELDRRARQLERNQLERERRVVHDERVRIARELHDVVAHHVSVMGIQAGAARTVLDESPARARELLASIEESSRRAVDEMRRLLSALRDDGTADSADRPPRLGELDRLIASARDTGIDATIEIHGDARTDLPETVELSAYRIVQEAVTNVIRHASAPTLRVDVTYAADAIDLRIENDGPVSRASTAGRGLVGMRERAALFGGTLDAGPIPAGGFLVRAHLPIPP